MRQGGDLLTESRQGFPFLFSVFFPANDGFQSSGGGGRKWPQVKNKELKQPFDGIKNEGGKKMRLLGTFFF